MSTTNTMNTMTTSIQDNTNITTEQSSILQQNNNQYEQEEEYEKYGTFIITCWLGNLYQAKIYLYFNKDIDLRTFRISFNHACSKGWLKTAKWLYSLGKIDIHYNNDYAFDIACQNGKINIAKWLYSLGGIELYNREEFSNNFPLLISCQYGYFKLAKWLYSLGGFNLEEDYHLIFKTACENNRLKIVLWLSTLNSYYSFSRNNKIITPIITDNYHIQLEAENWSYICSDKCWDCKTVKNLDLEPCSICYEQANFLSNCNHSYCVRCLSQWIHKSSNMDCSICKQPLDMINCKYLDS